tara:strand:+ start:219 stop:1538 length:1320 start_codon:yes stop_codon:yes gene_type:complete
LGKNVDEFQRMNELREEAGMEPISGAYAMPHMLGNLDVGLGAVSLPAFTKTLGQATLPYAAMMGESVLAGTDLGRGMKEWPEDQPKDWRYALMAAGIPLSLLTGTMGARQLVSKIPSKTKGIQTLKQEETDETRRKILKGAAAGTALAALPAAGLRTLSKAGPTVAKAAAISPVVAKTFMSRIPAAMNKMSGGPFMAWKTSEYGPNILQTFKKYGLTDKDFFSMDDMQIGLLDTKTREATRITPYGETTPIMNRYVFADGEKILKKGQKVKDQWTKSDTAESYNPYASMDYDDPLTLWNDALDSAITRTQKLENPDIVGSGRSSRGEGLEWYADPTVRARGFDEFGEGNAEWVNKIKFKEEKRIDLIDSPDRFVLHEVFDLDGIPIIRETFRTKADPDIFSADTSTLYMPNQRGVMKLADEEGISLSEKVSNYYKTFIK